jgi:hypothetical protein
MATTHFTYQQKLSVESVARDRKYQILASRFQQSLNCLRQKNVFPLEGPVA